MQELLPILNRDTVNSIEIERKREGTVEYMFGIYLRMVKANPFLAGHITGYMACLLGSWKSCPSPEQLTAEMQEQFEQGTAFAKALSGACLLYRLLESQAEADRMKEDLKLE